MSNIERLISFPLAGAAAWLLHAPPAWRRFRQASPPEPASDPVLWSADFSAGLYARGGATAALVDMLAAVRSGGAQGFDAGGGLVSVAANQPIILPGRGLFPNGQFANLYNSSDPAAGFGWTSQGGAAPSADGPWCCVESPSSGDVQQLVGTAGIDADNSPRTFWFDVKKEESADANGRLLCRLQGGTPLSRHINYNAMTGAFKADFAGLSAGMLRTADLGDRWRFAVTIQNNGTNNLAQVSWAPAFNADLGSSEADPAASGGGALAWPHLVKGPYLGDAVRLPGTGTLFATVNAVPEFSALDLSGGFGGKIVINLSRLNDPARRYLWEFGSVTDHVRLSIETNDRLRLSVRKANSVVFNLDAGAAFASTGVKEIHFQAKPNESCISATGIPPASMIGNPTMLPPMNAACIGCGNGGSDGFLNGFVEELQLWKVA